MREIKLQKIHTEYGSVVRGCGDEDLCEEFDSISIGRKKKKKKKNKIVTASNAKKVVKAVKKLKKKTKSKRDAPDLTSHLSVSARIQDIIRSI